MHTVHCVNMAVYLPGLLDQSTHHKKSNPGIPGACALGMLGLAGGTTVACTHIVPCSQTHAHRDRRHKVRKVIYRHGGCLCVHICILALPSQSLSPEVP